MLKGTTYIILATFLIPLDIYRIPTPLGYNITLCYIFFGLAICMGGLAFLAGLLEIEIERDTRVLLIIFILFGIYSLLSFVRNIGTMRSESMSMYLSELVGYAIVLSVTLLISKTQELQRVTNVFLASSIFIFVGAFWHIYNYTVLYQYVTDTPFWQSYATSEHVLKYLESIAWFGGFPRFRLPFSSPAGAGIFLSLAGILLLAKTLHHIASKKRGVWMLILFNLVNLFCLLGTFARASWTVFIVGSLFILWYFRKLNLISFGKLTLTLLVSASLFFTFVILSPIGNEFFHLIGLRFSLEATEISNIGHLKSRLLSLHYWTESPVTGLGIGGFFGKPMGGIHTHSTYFTILADRGLIGLLLFLGFLFQVYRVLKRKIQVLQESNDRMMLTYNIGFLGVLIGLLVGNFLYQMTSEVVWLFFGMILAYINLSSKKTRNFDERTRTLLETV